jgi:hypothetical protein
MCKNIKKIDNGEIWGKTLTFVKKINTKNIEAEIYAK